MVRIKVISRDEVKFTRETPLDLQRVSRNIDPELHPLEKPREYTRALNAVKLQKVFSKPFVGDLAGHIDGCYCMLRHFKLLNTLASGSCDGEVRLWNVSTRKAVCAWNAHSGFTRGLAFAWGGTKLYSCGSDKTENNSNTYGMEGEKPLATWLSDDAFLSIDHQRKSDKFATTAANVLCLWDPKRSEPITKLTWGDVKFNPIERYVMATTCEDRSITLYDIRASTPIHKLIMDMKSNCLAWNPMEAYNFTIANEDHNLYTFDTRKMAMARNVHMDHVSAVLDYSPTGQEFVTGSYDRTLRIFNKDEGRSREVYHTKRMQRIFSVQFSGDSHYVFCGSDDSNIRIWKTIAHANTAVTVPRQEAKQKYNEALIERYKDFPEIRRIRDRRHVPKAILQAQRTKGIIKKSQQRKLLNEKAHSKPGKVAIKPERKKHIITTVQ